MNQETTKKLEELQKKVFQFRAEINKETDRGCALMSSSFLENELMLLLSDKLVGKKPHKEELFGFNGPLGSFSSRIKMAYSMGLISHEIKEDLNLIRKVRNEFGHSYDLLNFESSPIKGWISSFTQTYHKRGEVSSRALFTSVVLGVLAAIHFSLVHDQKFSERKHYEMPEEKKEQIRADAKRLTELIMKSKGNK